MRDVVWSVGVGAYRPMQQPLLQVRAKRILPQKMVPHYHPAMGRHVMIGEPNPEARRTVSAGKKLSFYEPTCCWT